MHGDWERRVIHEWTFRIGDAFPAGDPLAFADEVAVKTLTADFEEGELERMIGVLANYQAELNTFAQAALGRYLHELPAGIVHHDAADDD